MSTNNKYSRTYFIVGLLLGLLIGIYASLKFIERRDSTKYMPITIETSIDSSNEKVIKEPKSTPKAKPRKKLRDKQTIKKQSNDSIVPDTLLSKTDSTSTIDSIKYDTISHNIAIIDSTFDSTNEEILDTLVYQVLNIGENSSDDNIHIAKNELIYAIYVKPQGQRSDFLCNSHSNKKRDSLLVNNVTNQNEDGIYVEFWRSPVNYTGYQLNHNTLVLFGVYQYTSIRLTYLPNGVLELNYLDKRYNLKCTDDFLPLNINQNN